MTSDVNHLLVLINIKLGYIRPLQPLIHKGRRMKPARKLRGFLNFYIEIRRHHPIYIR